jgi:hypothetical protein
VEVLSGAVEASLVQHPLLGFFASFCPPTVAGVALDGKGWRKVQLSCHVKTGRFLPLCDKCNISYSPIIPRANPATTGDQTEQNVQPKESKKCKLGKCKTGSDWPESEEDTLESG